MTANLDGYGETYKTQRWRIIYSNKLGQANNFRFTYMQMGFNSLKDAENELKRLQAKYPQKCIDDDYRVEEYEANMLVKPIYPFEDDNN